MQVGFAELGQLDRFNGECKYYVTLEDGENLNMTICDDELSTVVHIYLATSSDLNIQFVTSHMAAYIGFSLTISLLGKLYP